MNADDQFSLSWEQNQALKDSLFERAKYGQITGDEADAEALRLGLGSLSRKPGLGEFRPEVLTHWTLPMAVAWIAYLDLDEVREWSAPYRAECYDWHWQRWRVGFDGPIHEGWNIEQRSKPTLSLLGISAAYDHIDGKPPAMTVSEAREALWIALREGFFVATGIDTETGRRSEIPALDWHELVPVEGKGKVDEVRRGLLGTGYRDLLFSSVALRGFWRKPVARTTKLPELMRPDGDGFMPLFCAAQRVATEGGKVDFQPEDPPRWRAAYGLLLDAIASDKVQATGMRGGERDRIPGHVFAGIRVDYPYEEPELELMMGSEIYLRSYPYVDEQHWQNGFDDALIRRIEDKWTRILVDKAGVRRLLTSTPRKVTLSTSVLPLSMPPVGDGYMPLYCAAEWIATEGGKVDFQTSDEARWIPAFEALLSAIASEKVRVTGIKETLRDAVRPAVFSELPVYYPSGNANDSFLHTGEAYLQSVPYDAAEWRRGLSDKITSGFEDQWTALMVEKGDVRRCWSFDQEQPRSGFAGRPTSSHLVFVELARRAAEGKLETRLAAECRYLSNWLETAHPEMPQAKPNSIEDTIRARYWELRGRK